MDAGQPRLQSRNVEVFNSEGAVIAGTSLSLGYFTASFVLTANFRVLAVWYSPVGRVLQILDHIRRYHDVLVNFPI